MCCTISMQEGIHHTEACKSVFVVLTGGAKNETFWKVNPTIFSFPPQELETRPQRFSSQRAAAPWQWTSWTTKWPQTGRFTWMNPESSSLLTSCPLKSNSLRYLKRKWDIFDTRAGWCAFLRTKETFIFILSMLCWTFELCEEQIITSLTSTSLSEFHNSFFFSNWNQSWGWI